MRLGDMFEYLTGGRALSENLQLERLSRGGRTDRADKSDVAVSSLRGITIAEIDWSKLAAAREPKLDPLAAVIPADQHALFFPTFADFVRLIDEGMNGGTPVLQMAEPRSEDALTVDRYQRQLCLSLTGFGRLIGPKVIKSVALTGSDPFYRSGTDVAIVFEAVDPAALEKLLLAQVALAAGSEKTAKPSDGQAGRLKYHGLRSPDRRVSCYVAQLPKGVVVTNSTIQLERLAEVLAGAQPALASLAEFKFFRDRYRLGDPQETAFLFLSDATIRRWCGPRWRIAQWRRMRDLAVLSELQAANLGKIAQGVSQAEPLQPDYALAMGGEVRLNAAGVQSSVLGTLEFQTPIAEIPLRAGHRSRGRGLPLLARGLRAKLALGVRPGGSADRPGG